MDADMVGVAAVDGDHLRRSKRNKFRLDIVGMQFQLPHGPNKPRARGKSSVTPIKNAKCDLKDAKAHKSAAAAQNGQSGGWSDGAGSTPPRKADVRTVVDKTVGASASASSSAIQPIPNDSPAQIATKQRRSMPTEKRASSAKKYKSDSPIAEQSPVTVPTESPADASTAPPLIEPQYMDAMKSERDEQAASPVETARKSNDTDESSPSNNDPNADGDFSCVHCPAKYDSRTGLANHLKLHGAHKRFPCNRCDFSCDNPKTMRSHRRMHGPESGVVNGSKAIAKGLIVKKLKKRHVQSLTNKRASTYAASRGIASSSATGDGPPALTPMSPLVLLEEVRGAGGSTEKKTDMPQPSPASHSRRRELLHCGECPFQTKNPKRLAAHETGHKRVSGFKCPVCSFRSTSAGFLKRHAEGHGLASIPWPPVYEGEPRASASSALKAASQKKKPPTPTTTTTSFSKQKSDDMPPVLKPSAPSLTQQNKSLARNSKGQFAPKDELEMDNEGAEPPVLEFNEDSEVKENLPRCRVCSFVTAHRAELTAHFRRAHPALHSRRAKARKAWRWCRTCGIFIRRYGPWTLHRLVLHKPPTNKRAMKQMLSERRRLLPPAVRRELVCKSGAESGSESVADKSSGESPSSQSSPNARLQFCPECPFRTANKMEMTRHHENHTLKLAHQCEKCSFSCKNMLSLVHHRLMHERAEQRKKPDADQANKTPMAAADDDDDDQPVDAPTTPAAPSTPSLLKCEDCPYHAKVIWDMKAHRKMHIGNRKYRCDACSYNSHRPNALAEHKKLHDSCVKTDQPDQQNSTANATATTSEPVPSLPQTPKQQQQKKKKKLRPRRETKVRNKKGVVVGDRIDDNRRRVYVCRFCPYKASLCIDLARHARLHFGKRTHGCPRCSLSTDKLARLEEHVQLHPAVCVSAGRNRRKGGYQCRHCPFTAQSYPRLWHHMQKHKRRGKIACDQCTFSTGSPLCMAKHRAVHQATVVGAKRPKNPLGSISPPAKRIKIEAPPPLVRSKLNGVIATAPPILRSFSSDDSSKQQCDECPYSSENPLLLKLHTKLHFGRQRAFKCNVCSFSANMPESLYHHLSLHGPILTGDEDDAPKTQTRTLHAIARKRNNSLSNEAALMKAGAIVLTCTQCPFRTARADWLEQHRLQHVQHAQQRLLATIKRSALSDDPYGLPKIRRPDRRTDRQLHCPKCSFRCDTPAALRRHCDMHGADAPLACSVCDYRAAHINVVRFHEQNHHVDVAVSVLYKQAVRGKRLEPPPADEKMMNGEGSDENCSDRPMLRCSMCAFETSEVGDLSDHWKGHVVDVVTDKTGFLLKLNLVARSRMT